jgi:hypothetical protein
MNELIMLLLSALAAVAGAAVLLTGAGAAGATIAAALAGAGNVALAAGVAGGSVLGVAYASTRDWGVT